ncbi:MAG: DegT/DnrJ/EryC1/StrS family aminotransferase [Kiritimatiellia bacterium]
MQKRIFLSPPWVGAAERAAVAAAFDSGYVAPCGPMVDAFDARLGRLAGQHAAAVASGTAALDLLMAELGVGPETTVIASTLTFIATVGPAVHRGARPVFIDSDPATGTISLPLLEEALRASGKALVLAADIYGQCCDYDALEALCAQYGATLVIDAAEAVGATCRGRPAGAAGAAAVYSFNGNKLITTSGGGAVLSRDPALVARARWRAQQARENTVWYEHREVGYNYRMSNLLAAVGCAQLDRLPEIIRRKRRIFEFYRARLGGPCAATPFPRGAFTDSTRWLSVFLFPTEAARDDAAARLAAANIESRPVWKPLHLQPIFRACRVYGGAVAEDLFRRGLCLPSGAGLTRRQLDAIARALVNVK